MCKTYPSRSIRIMEGKISLVDLPVGKKGDVCLGDSDDDNKKYVYYYYPKKD